MKPLRTFLRLSLLLLLSDLGAGAATLSWDPSPTTGGTPPVVSYVVHSAPVGVPAGATWSTFGTTTGTTLLVTNNAYLMFRVVGLSAGGVASDPSNVVTNHLAKPQAPGNAIIGAVIESAPGPDGPFVSETNFAAGVAMVGNRFYRSRVLIAAVPPLPPSLER